MGLSVYTYYQMGKDLAMVAKIFFIFALFVMFSCINIQSAMFNPAPRRINDPSCVWKCKDYFNCLKGSGKGWFVSFAICQFCDLSLLQFVTFAICQFCDLSVL